MNTGIHLQAKVLVRKEGGSRAITIPRDIADGLDLKVGDKVFVRQFHQVITIWKVEEKDGITRGHPGPD